MMINIIFKIVWWFRIRRLKKLLRHLREEMVKILTNLLYILMVKRLYYDKVL